MRPQLVLSDNEHAADAVAGCTAVALRPGAQLRPLGRPGHERLIRARGALPGTYAREVDYMKWFLRERATWMDANVGRLAGT